MDTVGRSAFFIRRESENDIAVGLVSFTLEADQRGDEHGIVDLHVLRAASVEVAVLFDELEWIRCPILAARFDDIQVADNKDRLERGSGGAMQPREHFALAIVRAEDRDLGGGGFRVEQRCTPCLPRAFRADPWIRVVYPPLTPRSYPPHFPPVPVT